MPSMGQAMPAPTTNTWLRDLMRGIARQGIQARDPNVKQLWDLLRQRGLLGADMWLKERLRQFWTNGLPARERPRTAQRVRAILRAHGILRGRQRGGFIAPTVLNMPLLQRTYRGRPLRLLRPLRPLRQIQLPRQARAAAALRQMRQVRPVRQLSPMRQARQMQPVRPVRLQPVGRVRPVARRGR